jgi:hypothetical protein
MPTFRCYHCGFETQDKGDFIDSSNTSTQHWMMFICPQCALVNPPVAETSSSCGCRPAYKNPRWSIEETNYGLYVKAYGEKGGSVSSPILATHQLANRSASHLRSGLKGTMWDHHKWLIERGNARSAAFKADYEAINPKLPLQEREVLMDESRKRHFVGPHDDRVEHDGMGLMHKALGRAA